MLSMENWKGSNRDSFNQESLVKELTKMLKILFRVGTASAEIETRCLMNKCQKTYCCAKLFTFSV
jgi:hypothetical protein